MPEENSHLGRTEPKWFISNQKVQKGQKMVSSGQASEKEQRHEPVKG